MRGLLRYVSNGYDAVVVINFVIVEFVCIGSSPLPAVLLS